MVGSDVQNSIFAGGSISRWSSHRTAKIEFCTSEPCLVKGRRLLVLLATLLACQLGVSPVRAHPISLTQAFVFVTREKATVKLDFFAEDLFLFHNLAPNDRDFLEPNVIQSGIEKHEKFLLERFTIRDVHGQRLTGRVVNVEQSKMSAEGIRLADLMSHRISFQVEYPFAEPPEFLTFSQQLTDDKLVVPAEVQLNVKQETAGTRSQEVLYPGTPQTVRFSWDSPPLAPDASQEARDEWYQKQKDETLGITSYSAVYSFLYITDYEVRHEILIPLLTLEESVLIARADDAFLEIAEQDAAREQIAAYFTAGNPVEIDGVPVQPVVQRIDFYGLDFKDFAQRAERRRVPMSSARVGVILSYSTKGTPSRVQVTWDRFNRFIWTVNMIVYAFEDTLRVTLSRVGMENKYSWQNPGRPAPPPLTQVDLTLPPRPRLVAAGRIARLLAAVAGSVVAVAAAFGGGAFVRVRHRSGRRRRGGRLAVGPLGTGQSVRAAEHRVGRPGGGDFRRVAQEHLSRVRLSPGERRVRRLGQERRRAAAGRVVPAGPPRPGDAGAGRRRVARPRGEDGLRPKRARALATPRPTRAASATAAAGPWPGRWNTGATCTPGRTNTRRGSPSSPAPVPGRSPPWKC